MALEKTGVMFEDNVTVTLIDNINGALCLYTDSNLRFIANKSNVSINFIGNTALKGGGLYVEDRGYSQVRSVLDLQGKTSQVKLSFENNTAVLGGDQIYGGWIDWLENKSYSVTDILQISSDSNSAVASDPVRICLCNEDGIQDCNITETHMTIHGCTLSVSIVAVGQRFTPVVAYVEADIETDHTSARTVSPGIESIQKTCTVVKYKINSKLHKESFSFSLKPYFNFDYARPPKAIDNISQLLFEDLTIHLKKKACALGSVQKKDDCECICSTLLQSFGFNFRKVQLCRSGAVSSSDHGD